MLIRKKQLIARNVFPKKNSASTALKCKAKRTDTALIVNPNSCSGSTGKNWDSLYTKIKNVFGENPETAFSKKPGHGTTLARDFLRKGFKNIVAIGGDGTINEVANGFFEEKFERHRSTGSNHDNATKLPSILRPINPDAIMAILPCGTRNVLVKSLNLPADLEQCCQNFVTCKQENIDVIGVIVTDPKDHAISPVHIFLNAAEIGVAAEIIDRSKKIRGMVKSRVVSTFSSVVATLPAYESNLCEISLDDGCENIITKMTMTVIANGKYLGGGFKAAPQASVSDGLLDIVILKNSGSFKMLKEFISMKNGNYANEGDILYMQAKNVAIKSKEKDVTVTVDGEPIGILPATFQVYQNALTVRT